MKFLRIIFSSLIAVIFLYLPLCLAQTVPDNLYINVGQANLKKSNLAITPLRFLGTPTLAKNFLKQEKELQDVILKDLTVSSFFSIQPDSISADKSPGLRPAPIDADGFNFADWQQAGTEFLIKAGYNVVGDRIQLDAYVYHVGQRELILGKNYSAPLKDIRGVGHKFCNDIVEKLTGKKGFFLSKMVVSRVAGHGAKEIYVMDWDGANAKAITQKQTIAMSPTWSRDGRYVAYSAYVYHTKRKMRNVDLFVYDFVTGKNNLLHSSKGASSTLSFHPNLKSGVFRLSPSNGTSDLYKIDLQDGTKTAITNGPRGAANYEPAISPDGQTVAFSSDRGGRPMIYTMPIDGGTPQRLTFAGYYNASPAWSPDGKKIAFASAVDKHFEIFVMDSNGKNLQRLTSSRKANGTAADSEDPSFSPDGRFIMFRSNRTGTNQIYVVGLDGKNEYRISFDNFSYERPQWSPLLQ